MSDITERTEAALDATRIMPPVELYPLARELLAALKAAYQTIERQAALFSKLREENERLKGFLTGWWSMTDLIKRAEVYMMDHPHYPPIMDELVLALEKTRRQRDEFKAQLERELRTNDVH